MTYDITIVGGGIVGLATAYQILEKQPDTKLLLLEKEDTLAFHQTGHNSGVIHSGIYYKPGSLKARNCRRGYEMLVDFCDKENIEYDLCSKVIVATDEEELPRLQNLYERGQENGLEGMKLLGPEEIREKEPHCAGIKAIWVPHTGIVDYKEVCMRLADRASENGAEIKLGHKVNSIKEDNASTVIETNKGTFHTKLVVNCAGLYSDKVAQMTLEKVDTRIIPFRGEYYEIKPDRQHLVKNLIYPVPDPAFPFLGVHFTRMIKGGVEAGPNAVFAFKREGYTNTQVNLKEMLEALAWPGFQKVMAKYWKTGMGEMYRSFSKASFTRALQRLIPEVEEEDLHKAPAGVRAQACDRTGGLLDDFKILEDKHAVHVVNAPSPAATSSLSIGQTVAEKALEKMK